MTERCVLCDQLILGTSGIIVKCTGCNRAAYEFETSTWFVSTNFCIEVAEYAQASGHEFPDPTKVDHLFRKLTEHLSKGKT